MTEPFRTYPGYFGHFTRDEAEGSIPNGTRITKINSEAGDNHPDGSKGVVLGSIAADIPKLGPCIGYFVEWDAKPRCAVFVADKKLTPATKS